MKDGVSRALAVAALTQVAACPSSGSGGTCAPPPFVQTACSTCIADACKASVEAACDPMGTFSSCYCPCVGKGDGPAECTMSCAGSSCEPAVVACVEAELGGACASACGTKQASHEDGGKEAGKDGGVDAKHADAPHDGAKDAQDTGTDSSSDGGTTAFQSCASPGPGLTNCGASMESCCTSPRVAGGTFYRTYSNFGTPPITGEAAPATVSSYRLDKYDVTVGRFRAFVSAALPPDGGAGWRPKPGSGKHTHLYGGKGLLDSASLADGGAPSYEPGWVASYDANVAPTDANLACSSGVPGGNYATWTTTAGSQENLPINCVNWFEAYAFCIWDGGFLPSEAEWLYAAAGGSMQNEFPWGETLPGTSNQYAIYGGGGVCYYPTGALCSGVTNIAPVGTATLGAGVWGQLDLVGELEQWNLDWIASYVVPCTDCADSTSTGARVNWGGEFPYGLNNNSTGRLLENPMNRTNLLGFRCARTP